MACHRPRRRPLHDGRHGVCQNRVAGPDPDETLETAALSNTNTPNNRVCAPGPDPLPGTITVGIRWALQQKEDHSAL